MGQLRRLLIVATLLWPAFTLVGAGAGCEDWEAMAGVCGGSNEGSHIELYAELHSSGPATTNEPSESNGDDQDEVGAVIADQPSAAPTMPENCSPLNAQLCATPPTTPADPATPAPAVVVTLRDIASFVPAKPSNDMEPGGWAVEDLPANFVAGASVQVVSGTLLGQPADVRFTPVGYRWRHSDGVVVESGVPGMTWAALGQREFTATGTSHVYAESGEYTVAVEVVLRAEYRFAGSAWRSIAGTLAVAGDQQRVLVGDFDTVLTDGDCNANPAGPGC